MCSLADDHPPQAETIDIRTCNQTVPKTYHDKVNDGNDYTTHHSHSGSKNMGRTIEEASRYSGKKFSLTPYITPREHTLMKLLACVNNHCGNIDESNKTQTTLLKFTNDITMIMQQQWYYG
ncbi:unnamed protein product [Lathyrus sativus]|nr:unnamed protein product [Lathyrus sativus]